eukprot:bmy_04261T0
MDTGCIRRQRGCEGEQARRSGCESWVAPSPLQGAGLKNKPKVVTLSTAPVKEEKKAKNVQKQQGGNHQVAFSKQASGQSSKKDGEASFRRLYRAEAKGKRLSSMTPGNYPKDAPRKSDLDIKDEITQESTQRSTPYHRQSIIEPMLQDAIFVPRKSTLLRDWVGKMSDTSYERKLKNLMEKGNEPKMEMVRMLKPEEVLSCRKLPQDPLHYGVELLVTVAAIPRATCYLDIKDEITQESTQRSTPYHRQSIIEPMLQDAIFVPRKSTLLRDWVGKMSDTSYERKLKNLMEKGNEPKMEMVRMLKPEEVLSCRYLRLSKNNIRTLLKLCKDAGMNVDIHPHVVEGEIDAKKVFNQNISVAL